MKVDKQEVIAQLNRMLAGVVRTTHCSMMIFGCGRTPLVAWFRAESTESLAHAQPARGFG